MKLILLTLLALALLTTACPNKTLDTLVQGGYDISEVAVTAPVALQKLHAEGFIDNPTYAGYLKVVRDIASIDKQFILTLQSAGQIDTSNKQALLDMVVSVANSLQALTDDGSLHIKDPAARITFTAIWTTAKAGALNLKDFLAQIKAPVKVPPTAMAKLTSHTK